MRVLYDDSLAKNPAGTGTFVRGLYAALLHRPDVTTISPQAYFAAAAQLNVAGKGHFGRLASALRHARYYFIDLPAIARRERCDAIFCPTSLGPLRGRTPSFLTMFDLSPLTFSQTQDRISGLYIRTMLLAGVRRARGICTISQSVAAEIRQRFPRLRPEAVVVAYPGPNLSLVEATPTPVDVGEAPYLLMVGTLEPRKNHIIVLRAFAEHLRRNPRSPLQIVLAGAPGWRYGSVLSAIDQLGSRAVRLGEVSPGNLRWLYEHAQALLFPSIYEGFGLPVLEAFVLGCPVIAGRIPSVVEIAINDAAILLDPHDLSAWSSAIDRVEALALPRQRMLEAARSAAQRFTWEACAASVVRLMSAMGAP